MSSEINNEQIKLEVGDLVFTRIKNVFFDKVARDLGCWSNHVALVIEVNDQECWLAESIVPFSRRILLQKYLANSYKGAYGVRRLKKGLTQTQKQAITLNASKYIGIPYNVWFDLQSHWQFCSKLVYQVYFDAMGIEIGKVENFQNLLNLHQHADLTFWRFWFLGRIPWQKQTVTPASQWYCPKLETVYVSDKRLLDPQFQL